MLTMKCSKCQVEKDASAFYASSRGWCKECHRQQSRDQAKAGYFRMRRRRQIPVEATCGKCHRLLPRSAFVVHANGRSRACKECRDATLAGTPQSKREYQRTGRAVLLTPVERLSMDLWRNCRKRAALMVKEFEISKQWVVWAVSEFCESNYHCLDVGSPFRPSLDRLDCKKGYTPENLRIVWVIENLARNRFTEEQLVEFCYRKLGIEPRHVVG